MHATIAFDVYGTLIDPMGVRKDLERIMGSGAGRFAATWREKQIEYLFRRALARDYQPFSVCTSQALEFTCDLLGTDITPSEREALMERYRNLPAYPGTAASLHALAGSNVRCFAFSNGERADLEVLLDRAGLAKHLDGIVSVHDVRSFKPDPAVYAHFIDSTGSIPGETWLVSGNPFDVIGARTAGWHAAWLRRNPTAVFDPWGIEPTVIVESLDNLLTEMSA